MKLVLALILLSGISVATSQDKYLENLDSVLIHDPVFQREMFIKPIEIYDNKDLQGKPLFVVTNQYFIIGLDNVKNDYKKYYRKKALKEMKDDYDFAFVVERKLPLDFVRVLKDGYVIPIDKKDQDVVKVSGRDLYFKLSSENLKKRIDDVMVWRRSTSLETVKALKNSDKYLKEFLDSLSSCIKAKNVDCLFNLDSKYDLNSAFKNGIIQWDSLYKMDECKSELKEKKISFPNGKYVVNWELYQQFVSLKSDKFDVVLTRSDFGKNVDLTMSLRGVEICGEESRILILYSNKDEKPGFYVDLGFISG